MWSTIVAISLGVTSLAALALFYYFRQRIAKVEHKVDIMFQLIQEHNTARQFPPAMVRGPGQHSLAPEPPGELIEISGDDADSDDSSIVSDTEEGDPLTISSAASGENLRAIELKLSGAEASAAQGAHSADLDDLDEVSDIDDNGGDEEGIVFLEGGASDGIDMSELVALANSAFTSVNSVNALLAAFLEFSNSVFTLTNSCLAPSKAAFVVSSSLFNPSISDFKA